MNIDLMILQAMKDKQQGKVKTYRAIKSEIQTFKTAKNNFVEKNDYAEGGFYSTIYRCWKKGFS